ncbi:MAG: hypothetical protein OXG05_14615 [Gammaproteobacteria bacterium]|nr:hypothetical protein [Gammaproteobacteria bacterium]
MPHMRDSMAKRVYERVIAEIDGTDLYPHEFVQAMMHAWNQIRFPPDRSVHGRYFEYVIGETLAQNGVKYMYYQADVQHVPLASFDWFLYHETHPVSISCKTKARERWKQAAHEAFALKQVYVQAVNYLVTIERLAATDDRKILAPQTIDHFVVANEQEYTEAIDDITQREYVEAVDQSPIRRGNFVAIGA